MALGFGDRGHNGFTIRSTKLPTNPWAAIIDVPRGREREIYNKMPPLGGYTAFQPGRVMDDSTGNEVEIYFENGKKKLKKIKKPSTEKRQLTRDEALESPDKMWLYLKQYNKKTDKKWEEAELLALDDGDVGPEVTSGTIWTPPGQH